MLQYSQKKKIFAHVSAILPSWNAERKLFFPLTVACYGSEPLKSEKERKGRWRKRWDRAVNLRRSGANEKLLAGFFLQSH